MIIIVIKSCKIKKISISIIIDIDIYIEEFFIGNFIKI
jgi:hypothetical protein